MNNEYIKQNLNTQKKAFEKTIFKYREVEEKNTKIS